MGGTIDKLMNTLNRSAHATVTGNMTPLEYVLGEVTSIDPLMIKVDNRLELDSNHFILHAMVQETWINIPYFESPGHKHHNIQPADSHGDTEAEFDSMLALPKIMLWRGLWVGDVVRMLRVQQGQFFYVLEREEGVTNEKGSE